MSEDTVKWKYSLCDARVKILLLPKESYRFRGILTNVPIFFSQKQKNNSKICVEPRKMSNG